MLPEDDRVVRIGAFDVMELQGVDAQGGAAEKALLEVEYLRNERGQLHTRLFVKVPFGYEQHAKQRHMLSVQYGDGDGLEVSAYQFLEAQLPVRIPALYFADLSRASSYYVLITEAIPFASRPSAADGYVLDWREFGIDENLPKSSRITENVFGDGRFELNVDAEILFFDFLKH